MGIPVDISGGSRCDEDDITRSADAVNNIFVTVTDKMVWNRFVDNCSVSALLQDKHYIDVGFWISWCLLYVCGVKVSDLFKVVVSPSTSLLVDLTGQEASDSPKRLTITVSESTFEVSSNGTLFTLAAVSACFSICVPASFCLSAVSWSLVEVCLSVFCYLSARLSVCSACLFLPIRLWRFLFLPITTITSLCLQRAHPGLLSVTFISCASLVLRDQ